MQQQGRVVGNRIYYGNYRGNCCSPQNRIMCFLVSFTVMFLLVGVIVTIVGFTVKSFWDESDDWCSFCKEDRLETERNTANARIVGPIFLGIGVILIIVTCVYNHKNKSTTEGTVLSTNAGASSTTGAMTTTMYNQGPQTTTSYAGHGTTHPPPQQQQYPSAPAMQSQPNPHQSYPAQPYPAQPYPAQPYPSQPYPSQPYPSPYPSQPDPPPSFPPPPSYNDAARTEKSSQF